MSLASSHFQLGFTLIVHSVLFCFEQVFVLYPSQTLSRVQNSTGLNCPSGPCWWASKVSDRVPTETPRLRKTVSPRTRVGFSFR